MRLPPIVRLAVLSALAITAWLLMDPIAAFGEGEGSPTAPAAMRGAWRLVVQRTIAPPGPSQPANGNIHLEVGRSSLAIVSGTGEPQDASATRLHAFSDGSVSCRLDPAVLPVLKLSPGEESMVMQLDSDNLLRLRAGTWEFTWMRSP